MAVFMMVIFIILLFCGVPVAFAMAISGTLALIGLEGVSFVLIPQRSFTALNSFPLLAVPFFILAGELMNTGGITRRIIRFSNAILGGIRGTLGQVNILASIIMAGFSGSATADAVAIGNILIPNMIKEGYPKDHSVGITASSACIGPIIPPSCVMAIYGGITGVSIGKLFIGGIIPGLLIGLALMLLTAYYSYKYDWPRGDKCSWKEKIASFLDAFWALVAPVIILGGIISGIATATEAGVITVVYAFVVGTFIYKEIEIKQIPKLLSKVAIDMAVPIIIISLASIFGWILARENFAGLLVGLLTMFTDNPIVVYLEIVLLFLIIGLFVEGTAALLIFVPILIPLADQMGYNEVHFALVVMIMTLIGTITPPVGLQLYIASSIAKIPISEAKIWPYAFAMLAVVLLTIFVPSLITYLPSLFFR